MHKTIHAALAAIAVSASVPAGAENWQVVGKGDKILSVEVDKDSIQRTESSSLFRIRLTYSAESLAPWKGDTLVATAILGCNVVIPLSFDHINYFRSGRQISSVIVAPWPADAPAMPAELMSLVCAPINWRSLSAANGQAAYLDPDSVKSSGSSRSLRMKFVHGDAYDVISAVVDCAASTLSIRNMDKYSATGTPVSSVKDAGTLKITPGTPGADVQKAVCS